ncbi:hypothetical protein [Streptomyces sp. NPDC046862]|uniref:hypothetical protein n=1 Tax=Streptomyces sp. NPDC046862 TaxID=3154603 RepID=UPI0034560DE0
MGRSEAKERFLVGFAGVLGLEDGLVTDTGPMRETMTGRRPSTPEVSVMPRLSARMCRSYSPTRFSSA